jgi:exonuclease VII small subunit
MPHDMILTEHGARLAAIERVLSGLQVYSAKTDARFDDLAKTIGRLSCSLTDQVTALGVKVDHLSQRVAEMGYGLDSGLTPRVTSLEIFQRGIELAKAASKARAKKIRKAILGAAITAATSALAGIGAWAAGLMKGWMR